MSQSTSADIDDQRASQPPPSPPQQSSPAFRRDAWLLGVAWFGTNLTLSLGLPLTMILKDQLKLTAMELSFFFAIAHVPIYIKPIAGMISDAFPIFGTRRRHYLLISLVMTAGGYVLLGLAPRTFGTLLWIEFGLMCAITMTSTVLGGYMVEVGKRENATGRLSAQRVGVSRVVSIVGGPAGGFLASRPFLWTCGICATVTMLMYALFRRHLREPPVARRNDDVWRNAGRQLAGMARAWTLWAAAGLVVLVIIAPGFGTALFYHSRDKLGFDTQFLGNLGVIGALGALFGAWTYGLVCQHLRLRTLLFLGILINGLLTLLYLRYENATWAMIITATESISGVWAVLPLYDLAARSTPRGSEALGYSVMMSVWNFTQAVSDLIGAWLYDNWRLTIHELIWVNTATTLAVLLVIPILPAVLMDRKDGDETPTEKASGSS